MSVKSDPLTLSITCQTLAMKRCSIYFIWFLPCFCSQSMALKKINRHLIISSTMNPLANITNGTRYNSGLMENELLNLLAKSLNFTYEVHVPTDVLGLGSIRNGTGTGALGQLIRKEVDLFTSGSDLSFEKSQYVDGSFPIIYDMIVILIPYPEVNRKSNALLAIYSLNVWICILVSSFLLFLCLRYFHTRDPDTSNESIAVLIIGVIASQGGYFSHRALASRWVWGSWCLALIVLANVYTGTLTSMLTAPSYKFLANSIQDVAANQKIMPHSLRGSPAEEFIRESPIAAIRSIGERFNKYENLLISTNSDIAPIVAGSDRDVFIASNVILNAVAISDSRRFKRCRLSLAKEAAGFRGMRYLFQKNSPLTPIFDRQILIFHEMGLMKRLADKYIGDPRICSVKENQLGGRPTQLRLSQLIDAFYLLAIGVSLAFLLFVIEVLVTKCKRAIKGN